MKTAAFVLSTVFLTSACERAPKERSEVPSQSADAGEAAPLYLGHRLEYWIEQAKSRDGNRDTEKTVKALMLVLRSDDNTAVVAAADALQALGPKASAAAPLLAGKLEDHIAPWVRTASGAALSAMGAASVPTLVEVLRSGPGSAPIRAAVALGSIGPDARDAVPALQAAAQKSSPARRAQFLSIIAQIQPPDDAAQPPASGASAGSQAAVVPPRAEDLPADSAEQWTGLHGPRRDSICRETGLLSTWPEGGPPLLWKLEGLGKGLSTVSVVDGRIFTMGDRKTGAESEAQFVIAYDAASRRELWAARVGPPHKDGPRCTPTVAGGLVFAIGTEGDLVCVEAATGKERWRKSLPKDFDGKVMSVWKYSESPLVDGNRVVCTPGGPSAAMVALDKKDGSVVWKCRLPPMGDKGKDGAGYSSAVCADICGVRQYVQLLGRGVIGVEAATGRFLWGYNRIANTTANITHPAVRGDYVFVTTCYGTGSALLQIARDGNDFHATEVYFLGPGDFANHHGGVVIVGNHVYGGHGQNNGRPTCLDLATGKIAWKVRAPARGSASVLYADGHVIFRYDRGLVALVEANPDTFRIQGEFTPPLGTGPAWAHPVIQDGRLYLRHNDMLLCYDVKASR